VEQPAKPQPAPAAQAAAPAAPDVRQTCLALAKQRDWAAALDPCMEAANRYADDLAVKHAYQMAQAGVEELGSAAKLPVTD